MAYRGAMSNPDECAYKAKVDSSSEADGPGFPSVELDTRRKTSLIVGGGVLRILQMLGEDTPAFVGQQKG